MRSQVAKLRFLPSRRHAHQSRLLYVVLYLTRQTLAA